MRYGFSSQKCPKCGGNTYIDMDCYLEGDFISWYEQESCLQCGYISYEMESPLTEATVNVPLLEKEPSLV